MVTEIIQGTVIITAITALSYYILNITAKINNHEFKRENHRNHRSESDDKN